MAAKQHRVSATMIVAKVPGAQGGETYLQKGRLLPSTVEAGEIKRLKALGLIEEYDAPKDAAPAAPEPFEGVNLPELKAEVEKRNADRPDEAKITVAAPGNRPEIVAALVADDARQAGN